MGLSKSSAACMLCCVGSAGSEIGEQDTHDCCPVRRAGEGGTRACCLRRLAADLQYASHDPEISAIGSGGFPSLSWAS